jgi:hypothetical protein
MGSETDRLLEVDPLDDAPEPSPPAKPIVLVQYRNRGVPLWLFIPLVIIVPMSVIAIYHRVVVVGARTQEALARQAFERQVDRGQDVVLHPAVSKPSEPLALNSQPFVPETAPVAPIPAPRSTTRSDSIRGASAPPMGTAAPASPISVAARAPDVAAVKSSDSGSQKQISAQPKTGAGAVPVAGLASMPTATENPPAAAGKTTQLPAQSILQNPMIQLRPPGKAATPTEVAEPIVATDKASNQGKESLKDSHSPMAVKSVKANGEPASVFDVGSGNGEVVEVKPEPLPTKEESVRQIANEAAKKQAEIDKYDAKQQAEFHAMRQSERVKFRDELRNALHSFGDQAGPEIDKLAKRYGYEFDRQKQFRADYAWKHTRMTTREKVRLTRSLDLPETAILHFLSDQLAQQIGKRDGPRNRNEARIRAANLLLRYELPATDSASSPDQTVRAKPGVASNKTRENATSGPGVGSRSQ